MNHAKTRRSPPGALAALRSRAPPKHRTPHPAGAPALRGTGVRGRLLRQTAGAPPHPSKRRAGAPKRRAAAPGTQPPLCVRRRRRSFRRENCSPAPAQVAQPAPCPLTLARKLLLSAALQQFSVSRTQGWRKPIPLCSRPPTPPQHGPRLLPPPRRSRGDAALPSDCYALDSMERTVGRDRGVVHSGTCRPLNAENRR